MIYVTHDQTEAMTMGDRMVVMKDGLINQVDTPMNLYNNPINKFVAGFIGSPAMNFIEGILSKEEELKFISKKNHLSFSVNQETSSRLGEVKQKEVVIGIRPENFSLEKKSPNISGIIVTLQVIEPMGNETFIHFNIDGNESIARIIPIENLKVGESINLYFDSNSVCYFNKDTEGILV
jgi:multiple sugar transport system ATP-binding protein